MRYLIVDGMLGGTGIRDGMNGDYLEPNDIGLSIELSYRLTNWLVEYEDEHYHSFENVIRVHKLDQEGKEIAIAISQEIPDTKIAYYSHAELIKEELMTSTNNGDSVFWLRVN